jgi:putative ABC transport system permease protein
LRFDEFHTQKENIFLLEQTLRLSEGEYKTSGSGSAYAPSLELKFPEIRKTVRIGPMLELLFNTEIAADSVIQERRSFIETRVLAVDSTFFEVFTFPLIKGNPKTALVQPNSIVLTEEMAVRYFEQGTVGRDHQNWRSGQLCCNGSGKRSA